MRLSGVGIDYVVVSEVFRVQRCEFSLDDPFAVPSGAQSVPLVDVKTGSPARLATDVALYYDQTWLTAVFSCADDRAVATLFGHDMDLFEEDVVELFLAPQTLTVYYEVEVSPLATTFDARIESPHGERESMHADRSWDPKLFAAVMSTPGQLQVVARISFDDLGGTPARGDVWRGNLFRIDRHPDGDEYTAWRPTLRTPADFHVPSAFGRLLFE